MGDKYMNARNRKADVIKLRCNALQDFLKLILRPNWQIELYKVSKQRVENGDKKDIYYENYNKMRLKDPKDYSVYDMDVSFIYEIVLHRKSLFSQDIRKDTFKALKDVKDDRNGVDHSDENEEMKELYLSGLISLKNLKDFVKEVNLREISIDDVLRMEYGKEYTKRIDALMDILDEERIELIQKEKDIRKRVAKILESDNQFKEWVKVEEYFMAKSKFDHNYEELGEFATIASEAGVAAACDQAWIYNRYKRNTKASEIFDRLLESAIEGDCITNSVEGIVRDLNQIIGSEGDLSKEKSNLIDECVSKMRKKGIKIEHSEDGLYKIIK